MYFLQCIDYLFNTKLHNSNLVDSIQNAHVLCVTISCGIGLVYYANYSYDLIPYLSKLIIVQCSVDLLLTNKLDIVFHHLITISMAYFSFSQFPSSPVTIQMPYAVIISSEISSFFLILNRYFPKSSINHVCFISTFLYTRIYLYLRFCLFNQEYMTFVQETLTFDKVVCHHFLLYAFLFINVYWASIIIKTIYKKLIKKDHSSFRLNEYLLQYTYFLSPVISFLTYGTNSNPLFLLDVLGQSILSVNSYYYHHALYKAIKRQPNKPINILDNDICNSYIVDILSIQLRTFLTVFVNMSRVENGMVYLGLLSSAQMYIGYRFYDYIMDMKTRKQIILYGGEKNIVEYFLYLPKVVCILIGIFHNNDRDATNHLILSCFFLSSCIFLKPFYELNHFFIHIGLLYQSYAISGVNLSILSS